MRPAPDLPVGYGVYQVESAPFPLSETLEHWLGLFYIQQAATCLAAPLLDPRPGDTVLDLCAAPGGKTTHLAEWMGDRGAIVAVDSSEARLQALGGNVSRLAHPCILSVVGDALALPEGISYARILADVPCSGEGRLRQMPGHRGASRGDLGRLPSLQEALLRKALRMLAPGGQLLYVTCTLAPEENEGVLSAVLSDPQEGEPPIRLLPLAPDLPHASGLTAFEGVRYHPDVAGACRIHPHHLNSGGLFLALLEHPGAPETPMSGALRGWGPAPDDRGPFPLDPSPLQWAVHYTPPRVHTLTGWPVGAWALDGEAMTGAEEQPQGHRGSRGRGSKGGSRGGARGGARRAPRLLRAGLRGVEEGTDDTLLPLPTPDILRWMGHPPPHAPVVDLDRSAWIRLLDGSQVETTGISGGGVLLALDGTVLGTAVQRQGRLLHRLPEARARWLRQALHHRASEHALPRREPSD